MKKGTLARAAVIIACALVILALGLMVVRRFDQEQYAETRSEMSDGFGQLRTVTWKDTAYREKPAVTTILLAGVDKTEESGAFLCYNSFKIMLKQALASENN